MMEPMQVWGLPREHAAPQLPQMLRHLPSSPGAPQGQAARQDEESAAKATRSAHRHTKIYQKSVGRRISLNEIYAYEHFFLNFYVLRSYGGDAGSSPTASRMLGSAKWYEPIVCATCGVAS